MTPRHGGAPDAVWPEVDDAAPTDARGRRADASMSLLAEVARHPLDPGYEHAALHPRPRARFGAVGVVVLALLLGLTISAAVVALRQPSSSAEQARDLLERQIQAQTDRGAQAQAAINDASAQIATLQEQVLAEEDPAVLARLQQDSARSGTVAVGGPGLRVVLSDAPSDDPDTIEADDRVQDVDLQVLVNGLWAAGAEAIAINGTRLTSTTAIRSAGSAVLVDLVPLVGPYTVEAIGDAVTMQTQLAAGSAGQHLATLKATYGIGVDVSSAGDLQLSGTGQVTLRYAAVPSATPGVAASPDETGSADEQKGAS